MPVLGSEMVKKELKQGGDWMKIEKCLKAQNPKYQPTVKFNEKKHVFSKINDIYKKIKSVFIFFKFRLYK